MLQKAELIDLYVSRKMSSKQIAVHLGCSMNKVNYWLNKHSIPKRSISDAIYTRHNPGGDPFIVVEIDSIERAWLYGMGLGLYWGEGTKANKHSIRLGNSDPLLIAVFIRFLVELYGVDKARLRFGLQVFSDLNPDESIEYWASSLGIDESQFYKVHVTPSGALGTYRQKSRHGVLTLYYHNKRLRDIIVNAIPRQQLP